MAGAGGYGERRDLASGSKEFYRTQSIRLRDTGQLTRHSAESFAYLMLEKALAPVG
jgi:hypothetical protein